MADLNDRVKEILEKLGEDTLKKDELQPRLEETEEKINKGLSLDIKALKSKILLVVNLLTDYKNKKYTVVPWGSIVICTGALAYFVLPKDLIDDYIPGGHVDDALVMSIAFSMIKDDLEDYERWKANQSKTEKLTTYLDSKIGDNTEARAAEVDRLSNLCANSDITDKNERATQALLEIEG